MCSINAQTEKKDGVLMKLFDDRAGRQKQMGC